MHQLAEQFLYVLGRTTRFKADAVINNGKALPVLWPSMVVFVRGMLGVLYAVLAALIQWIFPGRIIGAVVATAAVMGLHYWLTSGKEKLLGLKLSRLLIPETPESEPALMRLREYAGVAIPPVLVFLAFWLTGGSSWLVAAFTLGAAAGCSYLRGCPNADDWRIAPNAWWSAVAMTLGYAVLSVLLGHLLDTQCIFFQWLVRLVLPMRLVALTGCYGAVALLTLLLLPWMQKLQRLGNDFATLTYFAEVVVLLQVLIGALLVPAGF